MICRPARGRRIDPFKGHLGQIERADKNVDHTNRIVLADPVFHAFRKQRALPTIDAFDEALHPIPLNRAGIVTRESPQAACFYTWDNSGIEPYSGSGNQLSRKTRPASWGLAIMENRNGALYWTGRIAEADSDLHRRSDRKD